MLERHEKTVRAIEKTTRVQMISYFVSYGLLPGDVPGVSFFDTLQRARLCQADLVLCLLRLNTPRALRHAAKLVGRPITHCPPCLRQLGRRPRAVAAQLPDDRVVIRVRPPAPVERGKRRLLCSPMYDRLAKARVGATVAQLVARGITRRDLRIATRRGYLEIGERRA